MLVTQEQAEPSTDYIEKQVHTFNLGKELASSIYPGIEFTAETPADHPDTMMVPMLDLQTWIHPGEDGDWGVSCTRDWQQQLQQPQQLQLQE